MLEEYYSVSPESCGGLVCRRLRSVIELDFNGSLVSHLKETLPLQRKRPNFCEAMASRIFCLPVTLLFTALKLALPTPIALDW